MIVGSRTIKAYGWENHYIDKIKSVRALQIFYIKSNAFIRFFTTPIFQNAGLLATMIIYIPQWQAGKKLD